MQEERKYFFKQKIDNLSYENGVLREENARSTQEQEELINEYLIKIA